jgi:hypothetical protein
MRILNWLMSILGNRIWAWLAPFMIWIAAGAGIVLFMVFAQSITALKAIGTVLKWSIWLLGLPLAAVVSIVEKTAAWRAEVSGEPIAKLRPVVAGYYTLGIIVCWAVLSILSLSDAQPGPNPGPNPRPQPGPNPGPNPGPQPGPEPQPWDPVPAPSEWDLWYNAHKQTCKQCARPFLPMCREAREMKKQLTGTALNVWTPPQN